jgi:hypothetical protein
MPSYFENKAEAYGCPEELKIDPRAARACTPGWHITVIAMPQKRITMKIKLEVILGQQLAIQADGFLGILDESCHPMTGSQMIMREQEAARVCFLCFHRGHTSVDSHGLNLEGPQNKAECVGGWYQSNVNMRNLPKLYQIRNKCIQNPGATMHQWAGAGIWRHGTPKDAQKQQHKKVARNKCNRNWQGSRRNVVEAVNQVYGANKVEIK